MNELLKAIDNLPLLVKVLLALPVVDIVWAIYRIADGVVNNKIGNIVLGIVWILAGATICWVLDIVFLLLKGSVLKF